jgi:RNA polymerase sigma factor (TIGR02999 family)
LSQSDPSTVTRLVNALGHAGAPVDEAAFHRLYLDLKGLASAALSRERDRGPFQTTALVHEALVKMGQFDGSGTWQSRAHFFGAAARAMRQILVDEARRRRSEGRVLRMLAEASERTSRQIDLLHLDEALAALEQHDKGLCQIVMLRVFAGLTVPEVAETLDSSERTIKRDWQVARAWLLRWLIDRGHGPADGGA